MMKKLMRYYKKFQTKVQITTVLDEKTDITEEINVLCNVNSTLLK